MFTLLSITTQRQSLFNFDLTEILIRTQKKAQINNIIWPFFVFNKQVLTIRLVY